jgi:outer membrane autotransporter protein
MQPANLNNIAFAEENVAERVRQMYTDHFFEQRALACPEKKVGRFWLAPFAETVRQHGKSHLPGYREFFAGFSAAFDVRTPKHWMFTGGFSFADTHLSVVHGKTQAHLRTYAGSLGLSWAPASWFFDLLASYLFSPIHAERKMDFSSKLTLKAKHHNHSGQVLGHFGTGYVFNLTKSKSCLVNIYPFANVDYQYIEQSSYKERGAHRLNLEVPSQTYDLLRPEGGLGLAYRGCFDELHVLFDLSTSYIHEFRFLGETTHAHFASSGCHFSVKGLKPENNLISPQAKFRFAFPKHGFSMTLGYHGEFGKHISLNAGEMEFRIAF